LPVSMTPAKHVFASVMVVDTVDAPVGPLTVRQCI
jgi:hypothetical protein